MTHITACKRRQVFYIWEKCVGFSDQSKLIFIFFVTSQAVASVCQRFCQTSGPDWWSASSPWLIPIINSAMTTWSVLANTPSSCSLLETCRANYVYKCVWLTIHSLDHHDWIDWVIAILFSFFPWLKGHSGFCCCQSSVTGLVNWSGYC